MVTYTYFVQKYFVDGDPRPKYIASSKSFSDLASLVTKSGIHFGTERQMFVTVTEEIPEYKLTNPDHCTFCNDVYNPCSKLFCGMIVVHYTSC